VRDSDIVVVMSPDSAAFAYALEYRRHGSFFGPRAEARVEFYTYDLAHRKGPRQIAGWSHEPDRTFLVAGWTADGLFIESRVVGRDTTRERLEPATGARNPAGANRGAPPPNRSHQGQHEAERRLPHNQDA
jgi:hypothetical protein